MKSQIFQKKEDDVFGESKDLTKADASILFIKGKKETSIVKFLIDLIHRVQNFCC